MKRSDDRHEALIGEIRGRLVNLGVPARCFDVDAYVVEGYTLSLLAKHLRLFRGVPDDSMLEKVFAIGIRDHRFPAVAALTPAVFYSFVERRSLRLSRTRGSPCSRSAGLTSRRRGRRLEASVAELESRIRRAEAKLEKRLRAVEAKHFPVGCYVEMNDPDMHRACWDEYVKRLRDMGETPPGITSDLLVEAYDVFNGEVRMKHVLQYLDEDEARKKALTDYIAARLKDLAP